MALLLGALFAYIFYPIHRFLKGKIKFESVSALLVCVGVLLLFLIPSIFFVKSLFQEASILFLTAKEQFNSGVLEHCSLEVCKVVQQFVGEPTVQGYIEKMLHSAAITVIEKGSAFLVAVPQVVLTLFVMFFTMFYFLKGGEEFLRNLNLYLRLHQKKYVLILQRLQDIVRGVVFGYVIVALMQGALGAVGFFLFGVSSPLFWGFVMALLALIPFLGTGFVWIPAAGYIIFQGVVQNSTWLLVKGVGLFVYGLIFVSTLDNFIRPKLISEKANIHPVVVMIGIFGGLLFFGPIGVIVGPLVLCLTMVFLQVYLSEEMKG